MVLKPFSGRFLSFPVHLAFLETQTLQMISTMDLPGSPEETEKMEANRNKRITSGLPKHKILWKVRKVGGHKVLLQVHHSRKQQHIYSLIWSLSTWLLCEQDFI